MRMYPPGSDAPYDGTRLKRFLNVDMEYIVNFDEKKIPHLINRLGWSFENKEYGRKFKEGFFRQIKNQT